MKKIPLDTKNSIITLLDNGLSARKIHEQLNISPRTVDKIRREARPNVTISKGGWPSSLTATDHRWLVRMITSGQADNAAQLAKSLGKNISKDTICHALKTCEMKSAVKKKKPRLTAKQIWSQLEFATWYQHWTVDDWKWVIFSDETKINHFGSDGCQWVWKWPGEGIKKQHIKETLKFSGGSLMMWGCTVTQKTVSMFYIFTF